MTRWATLIRLGFDSYNEYLRSAHWKDVRRRYKASGRSLDCICGEPGEALHHETYERLGCEELDDLVPLCMRCHRMVHELERRGVSGLAVGALRNEARAQQYAQEAAPAKKRARAEFLTPSPTIRPWKGAKPTPLADHVAEVELRSQAGLLNDRQLVQLEAIRRAVTTAERKLEHRRSSLLPRR